MELIKCDKNSIVKIYYKKTKNQKLLEEFINSNMDCAEVKNFEQKNAKNCCCSLNISIKRFHITGIHAIQRKNRVFLIKDI